MAQTKPKSKTGTEPGVNIAALAEALEIATMMSAAVPPSVLPKTPGEAYVQAFKNIAARARREYQRLTGRELPETFLGGAFH